MRAAPSMRSCGMTYPHLPQAYLVRASDSRKHRPIAHEFGGGISPSAEESCAKAVASARMSLEACKRKQNQRAPINKRGARTPLGRIPARAARKSSARLDIYR